MSARARNGDAHSIDAVPNYWGQRRKKDELERHAVEMRQLNRRNVSLRNSLLRYWQRRREQANKSAVPSAENIVKRRIQ